MSTDEYGRDGNELPSADVGADPSAEAIVAELIAAIDHDTCMWEKAPEGDRQGLRFILASFLARHGDARYEEGKREAWKTAGIILDQYLKMFNTGEYYRDIWRAAAREDGVELA
jgi:hypothetical protein